MIIVAPLGIRGFKGRDKVTKPEPNETMSTSTSPLATATPSATWTAICELCGTNSATIPIYNDSAMRFECDIIITEYLLILGRANNCDFQVPLHLFQSIFRRELSLLELRFKSLDFWRLRFPSDSECADFYHHLQHALAATDIQLKPYAMKFREEFDLGFESDFGWSAYYCVEQMMERMSISNADWRISDINSGYQLSESLPERLIVPASIEDKMLREVASFRQSRRLPHLTYHHPGTKAIIARSGQPLMGPKQRRSIEDEQYIQQLLNTGPGSSGSESSKGSYPCIIEARTKASGAAAKTKGGGYEADGQYVRIRMFFTTIEQPTQTKDAFLKFMEALKSGLSASSFLSEIGDWMRQVQSCLRPATFITKAIAVEGVSCLVHCDEGVDNTAILVSLAKLLIDPYYRTVEGFMALMEEEWLQAGFRFAERTQPPSNLPTPPPQPPLIPPLSPSIKYFANTSPSSAMEIQSARTLAEGLTPGSSRPGSSPLSSAFIENAIQQSAASISSALTLSSSSGNVNNTNSNWTPVFWLFLDCVYQIYHQFPREFQFNPQLLQFLIQQSVSGQFGTFLSNSPKELAGLRAAGKTLSTWTFISMCRDYFINPLYDPVHSSITDNNDNRLHQCAPPLPITSNSRRLTFLSGLFDPFDPASPLANWHRVKWTITKQAIPPTPEAVSECYNLLQRRGLLLKKKRQELADKLPDAQQRLDSCRAEYRRHITATIAKNDQCKQRERENDSSVCSNCQAPLCTC